MFCRTTDKTPLTGGDPLTPPLKKGADMRKVSFRLDEIQYQNLSTEADKFGIKISELIRQKISKSKKNICNKKDMKNLIYHISRIGNNLNQIAHYVNTKKSVDKIVLEKLVNIEKELNKVLREN